MKEYRLQMRFSPKYTDNPERDCSWHDIDHMTSEVLKDKKIIEAYMDVRRKEVIRYDHRLLEREVSPWEVVSERMV